MLTFDMVTLRPWESDDMETIYACFDIGKPGMWGGWTPVREKPLSCHACRPLFEQLMVQTKDDQMMDELSSPKLTEFQIGRKCNF